MRAALIQLVHNTGIGNECTAARKQRGQFGSYEASQIAGMGAHGMKNIVQHGVIHLIYAARYGLQQSAAPHYGVKLKRYIIGFQFLQYQILAEFKLVDDMRKRKTVRLPCDGCFVPSGVLRSRIRQFLSKWNRG